MRILGLLSLLLLASCGSPSAGPPVQPSSAPALTTVAPSPRATTPAFDQERRYLDALRTASVPLSTTGRSEIEIGRGVCAEVAKGNDPETLADDLRAAIPVWSSDNVTAVIRTALEVLC